MRMWTGDWVPFGFSIIYNFGFCGNMFCATRSCLDWILWLVAADTSVIFLAKFDRLDINLCFG